MPPVPQWFCAQIGAREHYAVARALHQTGRLTTLYTDFWAGPLVRRLAVGKLRPLAARCQTELAKTENGKRKTEIISWNLRALQWEAILRSNRKLKTGKQKLEIKNEIKALNFQPSAFNLYHGFVEVGSRFAACVRADLKRRKNLPPGSILYAYDTGALEAFEWCRGQGIKCVLNQMDPNRVEVDLVRAEERQWPGWTLQGVEVPEVYFQRREKEWALADRIVVNSEFSRRALLQQGVPLEKLVVIPLCYEADAERGDLKFEGGKHKVEMRNEFRPLDISPLRVLFLGQVILRKGIQYLMAAARLLEKENIHFDVVGSAGISAKAMATAPGNMVFHGRATRDQTSNWYRQAHVFVLPTLSDGFALTQLEAMAHGLPVVTTPCCGEVVSDGVDGFIVPPREADILAGCLRRYLTEPGLLSAQQKAALVKAKQFTVQRLAENLRALEQSFQS
jgi:glycosyltransferase involved in cell wall biosynthesis